VGLVVLWVTAIEDSIVLGSLTSTVVINAEHERFIFNHFYKKFPPIVPRISPSLTVDMIDSREIPVRPPSTISSSRSHGQ